MMPRPPASVTALASLPPDAVPIGARRIGWLMPSFSVSFVRSGIEFAPSISWLCSVEFETHSGLSESGHWVTASGETVCENLVSCRPAGHREYRALARLARHRHVAAHHARELA